MTTRPSPPFVPPDPASGRLKVEQGRFWYGTAALWTSLRADGSWPMAVDKREFYDKSFWWRQGYDQRTETQPKLTVTGTRLAAAPANRVAEPATNGFHPDLGPFMLTMLHLPAAGCWKITGRYGTAKVSFVVRVVAN